MSDTKHYKFTAAGFSGGIKFKVDGELHLDKGEHSTDAAAECVRQQMGTADIQFTMIKTRELKGAAR